MSRVSTILALLCALLAGALARDLVPPARADQTGFTSHQVDSLIRHLERLADSTGRQAESTGRLVDATKELGGSVRDAARSCK